MEDERLVDADYIRSQNIIILNAIEKRVNELIEKYPSQKEIFAQYAEEQRAENNLLEEELVCGIWFLSKSEC